MLEVLSNLLLILSNFSFVTFTVCIEIFQNIKSFQFYQRKHIFVYLSDVNGYSLLIKVTQKQPPKVLKKGVLKNLANFTGKDVCQSLRPAILWKKRLWHSCFPVKFAKFLRTPFYRTPVVAASVNSLLEIGNTLLQYYYQHWKISRKQSEKIMIEWTKKYISEIFIKLLR